MRLHDELWQAILARPNDDTPRLLYADWLEEHGSPGDEARAALIRAQIDLARLPLDHPRRPGLAALEAALLKQHSVAWRQRLPRLNDIQWGGFVRGLIGAVWAELNALPEIAEAMFQAQPIVCLWLGPISSDAFRLVTQAPWLGRIEALSVRDGYYTSSGLATLAESPFATCLGSLYLLQVGSEIARSVVPLLRSPRLAAFRDLHVCHSTWSDHEIATLAACASLSRLTSLDLCSNGLRDGSIAALAESPHVGSLEYLNLSGNRLTGESARALAESPHLGRLACLDIGGNELDAADIDRLRERFRLVR
jgi:uncharacterized protein (TIGR02996 family)